MPPAAPRLAGLSDTYVARVATYYLVLFAAAAALVRFVPAAGPFFNAALHGASGTLAEGLAPAEAGTAGAPASGSVLFMPGPAGVALAAVAVMACACLLMLPVAWIYVQTRRRKGYQQSQVQALIVLPLVVAGIAIMVKNSVALAFSLGGIVGAVSFKNNVRDTKDTIYIFLAIGVGLACGIQAMGVGAALSVGFNAVVLLLWWSDFGRAPAGLAGPPGERRLRRALAQPNRTSAFVSEVDREIFKSLSPDQLDALAERAWRRRAKAVNDLEAPAESAKDQASDRDETPEAAGRGRANGRERPTLRMVVPGPIEPARHAIEQVLERLTKRYELLSTASRAAGGTELLYRVRCRKRLPAERLARAVRAEAGPFLSEAALR